MALELPPELAEYVKRAITSGRFDSEEELVLEGIRLLREHDLKLQRLREDLAPALERLENGGGDELDFDALKARCRERLES